jgi:hypothetical protein
MPLTSGDQLYTLGREREGGRVHRVRLDGGVLRRRAVCGLPHGPGEEAFQVDVDVLVRRVHRLFHLALSHLY